MLLFSCFSVVQLLSPSEPGSIPFLQFNSNSGNINSNSIPTPVQNPYRQFNSNSDDGNSTRIPVNSVIHRQRYVPCYRHYIGIFKKKLIRIGLEICSFMDLNPSMQVHILQPIPDVSLRLALSI